MQFSHSRVETFENCPFKYKLRYLDRLLTYPNDDPANALVLGTAFHTGLEKGAEAAVNEYWGAYPIITDAHVDEAAKLEYLLGKARELLPQGGEYEVRIETSDFVGFIDLLAPTDTPNEYDLYDFKYSGAIDKYRKSPQLHIYKHYFEEQNPDKTIRNMYYLITPKVKIRQKKTESLGEFRQRIDAELQQVEPRLVSVKFDYRKVTSYLTGVKRALEADEYPKNQNYLCNWCDYQQLCEKGDFTMILPKNERRNIADVSKRKVWLYGAPFSGKTTFANAFPEPLMLNTDGNIGFVDAPYLAMRDEVTVEGRITKRKLAWEVFKETITELERKENTFKSIVLDLLEDMYEHCRLYMYREMGITHESDDSFKAWDKVRTEFLSTLKRLMNLDYENIILISHEDTSKDITRKGGDKITAIKPNLQEKAANKIAGMVDIVARVIADGDNHTLSFKTSEVIFGGGRLKTTAREIPLEYGAFIKVYDEANKGAVVTNRVTPSTTADKPEVTPESEADPTPTRRRRTSEVSAQTVEQTAEPPEADDDPPFDTTPNPAEATATPTIRTRKRRPE